MWRKAYLVCLFLPLTAGAIPPSGAAGQGNAANDSHHYWPLTAVVGSDPRAVDRLDFIPTGTSIDLAVQALQQAAAQSAPAANDSLLHVDLSRHVRLAMVTTPRWQTNRLGVSSVNVALFSLQW